MADVEELIDRLKDFRTRSAAKDALLEIGEPAVGPLRKALKSRYESVRWSAVTILGELRAKQAVPDLIEALKDIDVQSAAVEALQHITGEEVGEDYEEWRRWQEMAGRGGAEEGMPAEGPTDADIVNEAVYETDISAEETARGYVLRVPLGDRHQDVVVNFAARDSEDSPLAVVYTRCGEADPKHFEWALRQNVRMSAGAIGIADVGGKPQFVIVDVFVRSTLTPGLLIQSVRRLARKGDQLEAALTKADDY
jgi:hypothetical protein